MISFSDGVLLMLGFDGSFGAVGAAILLSFASFFASGKDGISFGVFVVLRPVEPTPFIAHGATPVIVNGGGWSLPSLIGSLGFRALFPGFIAHGATPVIVNGGA